MASADSGQPRRPSNPQAGFWHSGLSFLAAGSQYLRARLDLAGIETRDAASHYTVILAIFLGAGLLLALGYLFFWLALVFLLARAFDTPHAWAWITLGVGAVHLTVAALLLLWCKRQLARPMFESTREEFRKDQQWLSQTTENWH